MPLPSFARQLSNWTTSTSGARSLRSKLIFLCVPSVTVILAGMGAFQYASQKEQLNASLTAAIDGASSRLSTNLAAPVRSIAKDQALVQLMTEMFVSDIAAITVKTTESGSFFAGVARQNGNPIQLQSAFVPPTTALSKHFDIRWENKSIGEGEVFFVHDSLTDSLKEQLLRTLTEIVVVDVLLIIVLLIILSSLVTRPIRALTRVTQEIVRTGDLNQKITITSHDDIGLLAVSFQQMMAKLQVIPMTVREISAAVGDLTQLISDQTESTQQQSSGLAEATVTMQEIRQTSNTAANKAETVIAVAKKAEEFSGAGQRTVESSIHSLREIQTQIDQIVAKIADLSERTVQVGGIIETVKDLADQSNMLALNASIEAVKAGELGKGFGVVAREIRSLADQSIQATARVREVLTEIQRAIRSTATMTEQGKKDMEQSMDQIRASGESLREMSGVVTESSQAARQIAASVSQQNVGISQITVAIEGLNAAMEKSSSGIARAEQAASNLSSLSARLSNTLSASVD